MAIKQRNIVTCILLSIITCGIYGIYWFVKMNDEVNELANPPQKTSGVVAFLLSLVTCGIYSLYWSYKMGNLLDTADVANGKYSQNRGVIYLVLSIFGLGIVTYCLLQNSINNMLFFVLYVHKL